MPDNDITPDIEHCPTCDDDMVVPDPDNPVVGNPCPDCCPHDVTSGVRLAIEALHRYALAQPGYSWAPLAAAVEHLEGKLERGEFGRTEP